VKKNKANPRLAAQLKKHTILHADSLAPLVKLVGTSKTIAKTTGAGYIRLGPFGYAVVKSKAVHSISPPWDVPRGTDWTDKVSAEKLKKAVKIRWKAGTKSSVARLAKLLTKGAQIDTAGDPDNEMTTMNRKYEKQVTKFAPEAPDIIDTDLDGE
jgi:hypothetical protein